MLNSVLEVNENSIRIDHEGYLLEPSDWDRDVAQAIANKEGIEMTDDVWEVVMFVRDHFDVNQCIPEHRRLLQALRKKYGKEKATRRYIYDMFPYGYGQQACKIAGMRVPLKLLLDL
ncbi:MAG TPA: TusE/DsrC/DsvC family sulfur relay protein [Gammaproteobacteria bacterium]|nr:TusE/DsrC/DsvC family sulfur relay protein [Gammaproteobacteria bacterium]